MSFWRKRFLSDEESNLGRVLMQMDAVTPSQVAKACEYQREHGEMFGEALVSLGAITPDTLSHALRLQAMMRKGREADAMLEIVEAKTRRERKFLGDEVSGPIPRWVKSCET